MFHFYFFDTLITITAVITEQNVPAAAAAATPEFRLGGTIKAVSLFYSIPGSKKMANTKTGMMEESSLSLDSSYLRRVGDLK